MNNDPDDHLIQQVDDLLERGKPSDHAIINLLADTLAHENSLPQADAHFMNALEDRLVAQLENQKQQKEETVMLSMTAKVPHHAPSYSYLTWAAALIVALLMGSFVLTQRSQPALPSAVQIATDVPMQTIVIATQNIQAGTTVTADMLSSITLSASDFDKLQSAQPDRPFITDLKQVVGQAAANVILFFQPIAPVQLGQHIDCPRTDLQCIAVPKNLYTISLSLPVIAVDTLGLIAGDHVDVLTSVDNQLTLMAEDVVLTNVQPSKLTFATTSWRLSVLVWMWQNKLTYSLSKHHGAEPARDETRIDYTFTSPEVLPDDYQFHLVAGFPDSQGYQLVGAPYSLDSIQFTQRDKLMQFWFTDMKMVSITNGTQIVINLPASDAALLDFLLKKGATLDFIPQ